MPAAAAAATTQMLLSRPGRHTTMLAVPGVWLTRLLLSNPGAAAATACRRDGAAAALEPAQLRGRGQDLEEARQALRAAAAGAIPGQRAAAGVRCRAWQQAQLISMLLVSQCYSVT